jgi:protease-4
VWTGAQALDHQLVDALGDLHTALAKARQLANLPDDAPVYLWRGKGEALPPLRAKSAAFTHALRSLRSIANGSAQMIVDVWCER